VSFPLRTAIELVPSDEAASAVAARAERRTYLTERGYRLVDVAMADVEKDVGTVLADLAAILNPSAP
jgi:tRNA/rRNA methyltransferase